MFLFFILKGKVNCLRGGWWGFKRSKIVIILWRYNVFYFLGEEKKSGIYVSTKLVKLGFCLFRRFYNNLIVLFFLVCSRGKLLLFYFYYWLRIFRSDKCCDFFVKLNEFLFYILESFFSFWKCFYILIYFIWFL